VRFYIFYIFLCVLWLRNCFSARLFCCFWELFDRELSPNRFNSYRREQKNQNCFFMIVTNRPTTNEKDASTFHLTVRPLSGAVNTGLLLNSDGGARVKTSRNLEKNTLFYCHFMPLNWPIFGIFPCLPASPLPGLYCHTNISLGSSGTHMQRSPQCLSFCFIN
jgi:hypothetical protein